MNGFRALPSTAGLRSCPRGWFKVVIETSDARLDGRKGVHRVNLRSAALTDVGRRRKANEDCYALAPDIGLYLVADGM